MADWFLNLPVAWMALIVFVASFLIAGGVYLVVTRLAETEWARAFKAVSPGLLPVLGVLFALLVGFIAVEVWNTFDKAKTAVATEASALRAVVLLARNFPEEQRTRIDALIKPPHRGRGAARMARDGAPAGDPLALTHAFDRGTG